MLCFENGVYSLLILSSTLGPGEDYTGLVTSRLRFGRCETRQCVNIQIINDERLEDTESFNVSLEVGRGVNSRFILDPQEVSMYITDADGM